MNGPVEWLAAIGTIIAASLIAFDLGRRATGWGFILFVAVSLAWVGSAIANHTVPLAIQNAILLAINAWGVWQYLLNPRKKREIEKVEELRQEAASGIEREASIGQG